MENKVLNGLFEYLFDKKDLIIVDVHPIDLSTAEAIFREHSYRECLDEECRVDDEQEKKVTLCYIVDSWMVPEIRNKLCESGIVSRIADTLHKPYSLRSKVSSYFFNLI